MNKSVSIMFLFVVFILISIINANAQKIYTYEIHDFGGNVGIKSVPKTQLKIGDYIGEEDILNSTWLLRNLTIIKGYRVYSICESYFFECDGTDEVLNLVHFINENKVKLQEKLGVILTSDATIEQYGNKYYAKVKAITPLEQEKIKEYEIEKENEANRKEKERQDRINSLNSLL